MILMPKLINLCIKAPFDVFLCIKEWKIKDQGSVEVVTVVPIGHTVVTRPTVEKTTYGFAPTTLPMSHKVVASCAVGRVHF
jgi:hypothetical protein